MKGLTAYPRFLLLVCISAFCAAAHAQAGALISLQTENNAAFELRWNGKTYASSSTGSLLLTEVPAGSQSFTIVFAGETAAEHVFTVAPNNVSRAYSLRIGIDNTWSLFDLVDLTLTQGKYGEIVAKRELPRLPNEAPATVSADPPKETSPAKNAEPQPVPVVEARKKSPVITAITKIFDKSGSGGIDQVYILTSDLKSDTVALFIPALEELPRNGINPSSRVTTGGSGKEDLAIPGAVLTSAPVRATRVIPASSKTR